MKINGTFFSLLPCCLLFVAEAQNGEVRGHIYSDINGDFQQNDGEPNLAGVELVISESDGNEYGTETDADGNYVGAVPEGETTVWISYSTLPRSCSFQHREGDSQSKTFNVDSGEVVDLSDGFQFYGEIKGHFYIDSNGNGQEDDGEPALSGIECNIEESDGNEFLGPESDANGDLQTCVPPGETRVRCFPPADLELTQGSEPTVLESKPAATVSFTVGYAQGVDDTPLPSPQPTAGPTLSPPVPDTEPPTQPPTPTAAPTKAPTTVPATVDPTPFPTPAPSTSPPSTSPTTVAPTPTPTTGPMAAPTPSPATKNGGLSPGPSQAPSASGTPPPPSPSSPPTLTSMPSAGSTSSSDPSISKVPSASSFPSSGPSVMPLPELTTTSPPSLRPSFAPSSGLPDDGGTSGVASAHSFAFIAIASVSVLVSSL